MLHRAIVIPRRIDDAGSPSHVRSSFALAGRFRVVFATPNDMPCSWRFERLGDRFDATRRKRDRPETDEWTGEEVGDRAAEAELARPLVNESDDQREREKVHQRSLFLQCQAFLTTIPNCQAQPKPAGQRA